MNRKITLLLPIVAVLLISGCVNGGTGTGNGVVILDFAPNIDNVYSGDSVNLRLRIQNQGTRDATNVKAEIAGITSSEWGIITFKNIGDLKGYDPTNNVPGTVKTTEWNDLLAPDLPEGQIYTYTPEVRVSYDYTSTATKPITVVDSDELVRLKDTGGTLPSGITEYTAGPLSIDVTTQPYVRSSFEGTEYDIFPVYIKVTNTGGGSVVPGIYGSEGYPIQLQIDPPTGTTFRYTGLDEDCSTAVMYLDMWRGQTLELTCELEVITPPSYSDERLMTITADYTYQIKAQTQITVSGTRGF